MVWAGRFLWCGRVTSCSVRLLVTWWGLDVMVMSVATDCVGWAGELVGVHIMKERIL